MENRAHYALIGSFVLFSLVAFVMFVAWLSNAQLDQEFDRYEVVFTGPVRGLSKGSEVRYNGLRVGEVLQLRWDPDDTNTVIADIQVLEHTPVHVDSQAQLEPQGLTGLNYIQITTGPTGEAFRGRGPHQITGQMSQFDTFLDSGGSVIDSAQQALGRMNATMSKEAIADFHAILANIRHITTNLRDADIDTDLLNQTLRSIDQAAKDVSVASEGVDEAAAEIEELAGEEAEALIARLNLSLEKVDVMLTDIAGAARGGEALTVDARDALNRLSNSGLTDMEETAEAMRSLVLTLSDIADKLEQSPRGFIAGEERSTMELPQ